LSENPVSFSKHPVMKCRLLYQSILVYNVPLELISVLRKEGKEKAEPTPGKSLSQV
jgi:hypothetical protein